ncbi:hypothetical protein L1987_05350 [Smallanthus sonchifolius]|uniref:Uncharacterized protein n=1 Tax=Smallanthus sonchifolius TaxID=185202 RepID=A0ACB9JV42_9ASTR|nr:hypothetical protein L1987_05350 [Smallanthus sonchifolius]
MGSSTSQLSVRVLLISTGILSATVAMKFCFPPALNFAVYNIPVVWSAILSWLKPPYLYVIINGIIITIAASSRFLHDNQSGPLLTDETRVEDLPSESLLMPIQRSFDALEPPAIENRKTEESPVNDSDVVTAEEEDELAISRSAWNQSQQLIKSLPAENVQSEFTFPVKDKPLVTSRFALQRKMPKINPEGVRSLRVAKPRKHETLESTWKTITDGRHVPLNRHLWKPEIFENHTPPSDAHSGEQGTSSVVADYNLSSKNSLSPSGGKLRKEGSLSQDELNRRVEAFIKKFKEEMRLQRQESIQRYRDMINQRTE